MESIKTWNALTNTGLYKKVEFEEIDKVEEVDFYGYVTSIAKIRINGKEILIYKKYNKISKKNQQYFAEVDGKVLVTGSYDFVLRYVIKEIYRILWGDE